MGAQAAAYSGDAQGRPMQAYPRYERYQADYQAFVSSADGHAPEWLRGIRARAAARFRELGFPTAVRGNERWKYTSLAPLARATFEYPLAAGANGVQPDELRRAAPHDEGWTELVFVNGRYRRDLSRSLRNGITATDIGSVANAGAGALERHLTRYAELDEDGFTALNTAFLSDGAFIHVPDDVEASSAVHLLFVSTGPSRSTVSHPRALIVTGRNGRLTVVESYVGLTDSPYFTNSVVEIAGDAGSRLEHYRLLMEGAEAFHIGTTRVSLGRDAGFSSTSVARGARLARNDLNVLLDAPGSECAVRGLYMTSGSQHIDNHVDVDHAKPHTSSEQYFKGVLTGRSRAVFSGRVLIRKDAQKSNASQKDLNLMLSDAARVNTKPSMEIYADDVKAVHGATAGAVAEDALFYMRSRGIDEQAALSLLVRGFASEIIDTIAPASLREFAEKTFAAEAAS